MWCSCYYTFYFNALKRYPIPTPGMVLHNFTLIISVIIGGIPPGGIFWKKNPVWIQFTTALKHYPLFHRVFHTLHIRRSSRIAHQPYCIYPLYTAVHNQSLSPGCPAFIPFLLNNLIFSTFSPVPFYYFIQSIKLLSFSTLYHIYYYIISITILSLSTLSIQSDFHYYILSLFYLYIIFNTISHHPIFFYLICYITSILYQYNI